MDAENAQASQEQLGLVTIKMTMRYSNTLSAEESLKINHHVDLR